MNQFLNPLIEQVQVVPSFHVIPPIRNRLQEQLAADRTRVLDAAAGREGGLNRSMDTTSDLGEIK